MYMRIVASSIRFSMYSVRRIYLLLHTRQLKNLRASADSVEGFSEDARGHASA